MHTLAAKIRRETGNGETLVAFMLAVAAGQPIPVPGGRPQRPRLEQRKEAVEWLADRGWGKAKELIELSDNSTMTPEQRLAILRRLSDEDRAQLRQLITKALAGGETNGSDGVASSVSAEGRNGDLPGEEGPDTPSDGSASPEDDSAPLARGPTPPGAAPAPATHGRPRNVGRAVMAELVEDEDVVEGADDPPIEGEAVIVDERLPGDDDPRRRPV